MALEISRTIQAQFARAPDADGSVGIGRGSNYFVWVRPIRQAEKNNAGSMQTAKDLNIAHLHVSDTKPGAVRTSVVPPCHGRGSVAHFRELRGFPKNASDRRWRWAPTPSHTAPLTRIECSTLSPFFAGAPSTDTFHYRRPYVASYPLWNAQTGADPSSVRIADRHRRTRLLRAFLPTKTRRPRSAPRRLERSSKRSNRSLRHIVAAPDPGRAASAR